MDRFADLMDLRGDKSRLDAYFGGGRGARPRQPQQVSAGLPAAVAAWTQSQAGALVEAGAAAAAAEAATPGTAWADAAAAGCCGGLGDSQAAASPLSYSPAQQSQQAATLFVVETTPAIPLARADSCGNASEWDALSDGSSPPEDVAEQLQPEGLAAADRVQQLGGQSTGGAAAAPAEAPDSACGARSSPQQATTDGSCAAAQAAGTTALGRISAGANAAAEPPDADGGFALDSVSVREQEIILAMISARNARRGSSAGGSPANGGGSGDLSAAKESKVSIAATRSAPLPSGGSQTAGGQGSADDGSPAQAKQKRQRTLAGFVVPRTQSCKS